MKASDFKEKPPRKKRGTKTKPISPEIVKDREENFFVNDSFKVGIVRKEGNSLVLDLAKDAKTKYKKLAYNEEYVNFVRLYKTDIAEAVVLNLSLRAKEMYLHLLYNTKAGDTIISIDKEEYMEKYNISTTTWATTKAELKRAKILVPTFECKDLYWTSPFFFFNGNRTKSFEPFLHIEYNYAGDDFEAHLRDIKDKYWKSRIEKLKKKKDVVESIEEPKED